MIRHDTCGSKPMVPRPAAVTDTVLPSRPTRLMSTIGTFAAPAAQHIHRFTRTRETTLVNQNATTTAMAVSTPTSSAANGAINTAQQLPVVSILFTVQRNSVYISYRLQPGQPSHTWHALKKIITEVNKKKLKRHVLLSLSPKYAQICSKCSKHPVLGKNFHAKSSNRDTLPIQCTRGGIISENESTILNSIAHTLIGSNLSHAHLGTPEREFRDKPKQPRRCALLEPNDINTTVLVLIVPTAPCYHNSTVQDSTVVCYI